MSMHSSPHSTEGRGVILAKKSDRAQLKPGSISRLSNSYLQDQSRFSNFLKFLQISIVVALLVLIGVMANFNSTRYRTFATTVDGKLTSLPAVDRELGDDVVLLWLMDAVLQSTTIGFHDYQLRLQEVRPFFTDRGWESFTRFQRTAVPAIGAFRNLLENDFLTAWSEPTKPPEIVRKEVVGGVFTYDIRGYIKVFFNTTEVSTARVLTLEIVVERVPSSINPAGLAISRWRLIGVDQ